MANNRIILSLVLVLAAICGCEEPKKSHAAPTPERAVEAVSGVVSDGVIENTAVMPSEAVEQEDTAASENNPGSETTETVIAVSQVTGEKAEILAAKPEISDDIDDRKDEEAAKPADKEEIDQDENGVDNVKADEQDGVTPEKSVPRATDEFYAKYGQVLADYVDKDGNVNYSRLRRKRGELFAAIKALENISPEEFFSLKENEKKAFWINTHNIQTLKLIIDHYPIQARMFMILYPDNSIMQIPGGREKTIFNVIRLEYTLKEIEREDLLKKFKDPRISFALTYASQGSAFLRDEIYVSDKLDKQLNDQVRRFIGNEKGLKIDKNAGIVYLSDIFNWYKQELTDSKYGKIKKFRKYKPHVGASLNMIMDHIKSDDAEYIESQNYTVKFKVFNWRLNEQPEKK